MTPSTPTEAPQKSTAPDRSLQQRMEALQRANDIRTRRAQLKRDIKAGRNNVIKILTNVPDWAETMKVFDLLLSAPKFGRVKVNKILQTCRISPSKTVGGLSERQRTEIVSLLNARADTRTAAQRRADFAEQMRASEQAVAAAQETVAANAATTERFTAHPQEKLIRIPADVEIRPDFSEHSGLPIKRPIAA